MIKKPFVLILTLWFSVSFVSTSSAQNTSAWVQGVTIYDWDEVQTASTDTIYAISFHKSKLDIVPIYLSKFTRLKYLDLSKNKLTDIPSFFADFDSLETLVLTKNKLSNFPIEICRLSKLRNLLLGSNDIASIPDCIEYVSDLEYLDIYDNPIAYLPQSIMRMKNLKKIDFTGIRFNKDFQKKWSEQLPNTELVFDAPCKCLD